MTEYSFRVRAIDSSGAYADRDFSIKVRNTIVDKFITLDAKATNAYSSVAGTSSWTTRSLQGGTIVKHGGGMWIVFMNSSTIRTSPDAINWTNRTISGLASSGTIFHTAAYANGMWMAVYRNSSGALRSFTSTDGITWTQTAGAIGAGASTRANGLAYGGGKWFVGDTDDNTTLGYQSSDNGATWTAVSTPSGNSITEAAIYVAGRWIALDSRYTSARSFVSNNNMTTWTPYNLPSDGSWAVSDLVYGNGRLLASTSNPSFGNGSWNYDVGFTPVCYTSDNGGQTWTSRSMTFYSGGVYQIGVNHRSIYYNGNFHMVSWINNPTVWDIDKSNYGRLCVSPDGINWTYYTDRKNMSAIGCLSV